MVYSWKVLEIFVSKSVGTLIEDWDNCYVACFQHDAQMDYYGTKLATCSSDRSVKIFDVRGDQQVLVADLKGSVSHLCICMFLTTRYILLEQSIYSLGKLNTFSYSIM